MDWFIYAIISAVFAGLYHFSVKAAAEYNNDSSLSTFYSMLIAAIMATIFYLFNQGVENIILIIIIAALNSVFYFISTFTRIDSLKHIQATLYYPLYKTFVAILIFFIGLLFFNDSLSTNQIIGLILGIITILLLIQKKETKIQKNLKLGITLLIFSIIGAAGSASFGKIIAISGDNVFAFMLISCSLMVLQSTIKYKNTKNNTNSKKFVKRIAYFGGVMSFLGFYFFIQALKTGPFVVVYLINSFSILIITFLSVLVYNDHMDKRKALALILTIASLLLLK